MDDNAKAEQLSVMDTFHDPNEYGSAEEPRFLEQIQMFVDVAASKANIEPDMLRFLQSCDHALRF